MHWMIGLDLFISLQHYSHMDAQRILAAHNKGFGAEAIARLLGLPLDQVTAALPNGDAAILPKPPVPDYSLDELTSMGNRLLFRLGWELEHSFSAFRPSEALAITREIKDRTEGRAIQSVTLDSNQRVTHSIDDQDRDIIRAYILAKQAPSMQVIDVQPECTAPCLTVVTENEGAG